MSHLVTTFEDVIKADPPDEDSYLRRNLVEILDKHYPSDWKSWEISLPSYQELFGDKMSSDTECRLRFAVPTADLIKAFDPNASSASERKFKLIKRKLINWPLGRAVIYAPHAIMEKMHKGEFYLKFMDTVKRLKPLLTSRHDASSALKEGTTTPCSSTPPSDHPKEKHSTQSQRDDMYLNIFKSQNEMFRQLIDMSAKQTECVKDLKNTLTGQLHYQAERANNDEYESSSNSDEADETVENIAYEEPEHSRTAPYDNQAHSIPETDQASWRAPHFDIEETQTKYDFYPQIVEKEPKFAQASPVLAGQGTECQRLGSENWNSIRYADVQKHFQATPVFSNLKMNSHLSNVTPPWQVVPAWEKLDLCLGAVTHGLLKQRQNFQEIYNSSPPEIKPFIGKQFLAHDSEFRKTSDALLQYVCGRRAEAIQQRRSVYRSRNKFLQEALHNIPPSSTHLFSEPQLSDLVKEQGGVNKLFLDHGRKTLHKTKSDRRPKEATRTSNTGQRYSQHRAERFQRQPIRTHYKRAEATGQKQANPKQLYTKRQNKK